MGKRIVAVFAAVTMLLGLGALATPANATMSGPVLSTIDPASGDAAGGTVVTIGGSGFTGATSVMFGSANATAFTVDSDTQITAVTPANPAGLVSLTVTTGSGSSTAPDAFEYTSSATAPDAPTGLAATPSNGQVTLNWTAPAYDGGSPITGYTVAYYPTIAGGTLTASAGLSTSKTITGLTNGTEYTFYVWATNAVGNSAYSSTVTATPDVVAPGMPTNLVATPGDGKIDLTWDAPASDGGFPIDYYAIYSNDGSGWLVDSTPDASTSFTLGGLTNGVTYTIKVAAYHYKGLSPFTPDVTATPTAAATAPSAPLNLTVTAVGDGQVSLSWDAPASDGGSPITGYTVRAADWVNPTISIDVTGTTAVVTGLTNGTEYEFWVYATNAVDAGTISTSVFATPTAAATAPSVPLNVTATPGNGQITVTWDAPASDGGSPITQYGINYDDAQPAIMVTAPASSYTITGLTNGTTYTIGVYAKNVVGNSGLSATVTATPTAPQPDNGGGSPAQDPSPQTVTVTWNSNLASGCTFEYSTVLAGTTVTAPECSVGGYVFTGWDRVTPFIATSDVTVNGSWTKVPGKLTVLEVKKLRNATKFTYAYDDTAFPVTAFVIVNKDGSLACSSKPDSNTCTAVKPKGNEFYAYALNGTVEGPRAEVTVKRTIRIAGERCTVSGKPGICVDGTTTGFAAGETVVPWVKFPGQLDYTAGSARPVIGEDGTFSWSRKTGKKAYVQFETEDGSVESNRIIITTK